MDQWIRYRGSWYYLDDTGEMVTGRQIINGSVYFFHPDGRMASGEWAFDTANSFWYYATSGGPLLEAQWLYDGGNWYYFGPWWCEMATRMYWIDDAWYFFGTDGAMYSNRWFYESYYGEWHYAQASGALVRSDWLLYKGKWYYFDTWTAMVTGWHQIGDRWYLFDENGALVP